MWRLREMMTRVPLALVAIGTWWLAFHYNLLPWRDDFWIWANGGHTSFGGPLAVISAALIAASFLFSLYLLYNPWRRHGPDDAMGIGCVKSIAVGEATGLFILLLAMYFQVMWLIKAISLLVLPVATMMLCGLIYEGIQNLKKKLRDGN